MKNKEKYTLDDLVINWEGNRMLCILYKGEKLYTDYGSNNDLLESLINWLEEEYHEQPILDEKEKEYLSAVIRPWRDKVISIAKCEYDIFEFIQIKIDGEEYGLYLPNFEEGTMYKGMELDREYTLEELGI